MKNSVFVTKSFEETQKIAEEFAKDIQKGGVVALYGDLGAGKTTFVQGLAKGIGVKQRIISPTFIIMRRYELKTKSSKLFYHIDLYRTESVRDVQNIGISEIMNDSENIIVIEWAEKMGELLPKNVIKIYFEYINENERKITWKK